MKRSGIEEERSGKGLVVVAAVKQITAATPESNSYSSTESLLLGVYWKSLLQQTKRREERRERKI